MFLHLGELIPYLSLNFTMGKHAQQMIREHIRLKNKKYITLLLSQIKKKKEMWEEIGAPWSKRTAMRTEVLPHIQVTFSSRTEV